jgi:hypothetical protein
VGEGWFRDRRQGAFLNHRQTPEGSRHRSLALAGSTTEGGTTGTRAASSTTGQSARAFLDHWERPSKGALLDYR